jgi:hypothetical protein
MGTISISKPEDGFSLLRSVLVWLVYLAANAAYWNIIGVGEVFEKEAAALDWPFSGLRGSRAVVMKRVGRRIGSRRLLLGGLLIRLGALL